MPTNPKSLLNGTMQNSKQKIEAICPLWFHKFAFLHHCRLLSIEQIRVGHKGTRKCPKKGHEGGEGPWAEATGGGAEATWFIQPGEEKT